MVTAFTATAAPMPVLSPPSFCVPSAFALASVSPSAFSSSFPPAWTVRSSKIFARTLESMTLMATAAATSTPPLEPLPLSPDDGFGVSVLLVELLPLWVARLLPFASWSSF